MSPHSGWLEPTSPHFWPSEPPPGLGAWGRQTEHRLEAAEAQAAHLRHLTEEIADLRERLEQLEEKPAAPPEQAAPAPQPSPAGLIGNPNILMALYLAIGLAVTLATGKIPDLTGILK